MDKITPERWVILKVAKQGTSANKVFAGWYGGYLGEDNWRLNSGNQQEKEFSDRWEFTSLSGTIYVCYKSAYGMSAYMSSVFGNWKEKCDHDSYLEINSTYQPVNP